MQVLAWAPSPRPGSTAALLLSGALGTRSVRLCGSLHTAWLPGCECDVCNPCWIPCLDDALMMCSRLSGDPKSACSVLCFYFFRKRGEENLSGFISATYFSSFGTEFDKASSHLSFWIMIPYLCHMEKSILHFVSDTMTKCRYIIELHPLGW